MTLSFIVIGIVAGIVLKYIPVEMKDALITNIFKPAYTMFLNAIKMVVGPLVLFSIAASVAGLYSIIGAMQVVVNSTGDSAITTIMASWEKMIDKNVFERQ